MNIDYWRPHQQVLIVQVCDFGLHASTESPRYGATIRFDLSTLQVSNGLDYTLKLKLYRTSFFNFEYQRRNSRSQGSRKGGSYGPVTAWRMGAHHSRSSVNIEALVLY